MCPAKNKNFNENCSQYAKERDVRVMVDAEQSYFQPAISRLTNEMATIYNKVRFRQNPAP